MARRAVLCWLLTPQSAAEWNRTIENLTGGMESPSWRREARFNRETDYVAIGMEADARARLFAA